MIVWRCGSMESKKVKLMKLSVKDIEAAQNLISKALNIAASSNHRSEGSNEYSSSIS